MLKGNSRVSRPRPSRPRAPSHPQKWRIKATETGCEKSRRQRRRANRHRPARAVPVARLPNDQSGRTLLFLLAHKHSAWRHNPRRDGKSAAGTGRGRPRFRAHRDGADLSDALQGRLPGQERDLSQLLLRSGDVDPLQCISLSYGRGLDHLSTNEIAPLLNELLMHGASGLWAALEILLMYLYPAKEPDEVLTKILRSIISAPKLFELINRRTSDGHHLEEAVALLIKHGKLDTVFVRKLVKRMLKLAEIKESTIFRELDGPVRMSLTRLIEGFPTEVWAEVAPFLIVSEPMHRHRIQQLVGVGHRDYLELSTLGNLPRGVYLDWVRADPAKRGRAVMHWLPLVRKNVDGGLSWHPDLEAFVTEFGATASVLDEIGLRMQPRSWSGSIVPHLEPWLPLLQQWLDHPLAEVRVWAQNRIEGLQKYIAAERKSDEEEVVRRG